MPLNQETVDKLKDFILDGVEGLTGPGFSNMEVEWDNSNPPSPQAFASEIKSQVAGSIAAGVAYFIEENAPEIISPLLTESFPDLLAEALKSCEVVDSEDKVIGTIRFTPPAGS